MTSTFHFSCEDIVGQNILTVNYNEKKIRGLWNW